MRAIREDGRNINLSSEIEACAEERVQEFKRRLILNVGRILL